MLVLLGGCTGQKASTSTEDLKTYTFSEMDAHLKAKPRPMAIFFHAEWCKFCKNMEHTTFRDMEVVRQLNRDFYFISFDGESKETVKFAGRDFKNYPTGRQGGTHELMLELGNINGSLAYPAFVLMDSDYKIMFEHGGFISAKEMRGVLEAGIKAAAR
ncbi:MAG: thioredoxin family protein [Bacteroidota bacterium]